MSEVHRYLAVKMQTDVGNNISYTPHGPEIVLAEHFDRVTAERDALQAMLTAADERADVQASALARIHDRCEAFIEDERDMPIISVEVIRDIAARAALTPAEAAKCARCDCSTVEACDERGCGFLGSGNGAP